MTDESTTSVRCPNCEEAIEFKKWFLEDRFAVAYCKSPDCFYIFYPSTGEELSREEYQKHQRAPRRPLTLGISPDRVGTFHSDNEPQHLQVPCPECGRIFHQTKRVNRIAKFKCPRCKQRFEMDPKKCILDPRHYHARRVSKGISPDRRYSAPQPRPLIKYITTPCPECSKDVEFVEAILQWENHVVICRECRICFNPVTKVVVMTGGAKPKPGTSQDEVKKILEGEDK